MKKQTFKAFTLIELLIVIVIIGILAVALIPRLSGAQASARDTGRKAMMQQNATILSAYYGQQNNPIAYAKPTIGTILSGSIISPSIAPFGNLATADARGNPFTWIAGNGASIILCILMEGPGQGNTNGQTCATQMTTTAIAEAALGSGVLGSGRVYMLRATY